MKLDRRNIVLAVTIIGGLIIGEFIKRVTIGLLIGLLLGFFVGGLLSNKNKRNEEQ
jgi:uncharacterized protein YqgC (DUF456 family)